MRFPLLSCSAVIFVASVASANRGHPAVYRYSGRPGESSMQCQGCHNAEAVPAPEIRVDGIDQLRAGETAVLTLTISSFAADPASRIAGYVATTDGAGVFSEDLSDGVIDRCALGNGIKHLAPEVSTTLCDGGVACPSFFSAAGSARYTLTLEHLQEGDFTLFVAANDANNNRQASGDHGAAASIPLRIGPATDAAAAAGAVCGQTPGPSEAEDAATDESPGPSSAGCACTAAPSRLPLAFLSLLVPLASLFARRLRRR